MKKKNKFDKWFLLTWKKAWIIVASWFLAVILHNLFYALSEITGRNLEIGEVSFFLIAMVVIPFYLLVSFTYTTIKMIKDKSIFEKEFIMNILIAIILGVIVSLIIIQTTGFDSQSFIMFAIIFTFVFYGLIRLIKKHIKR